MKNFRAWLLLFLFLPISAESAPRFAACFGDHAVIQRGAETKLWGFTGDPQSTLEIQFGSVKVTAKIDPSGRWEASFPNLKANPKGRSMRLVENGTEVAIVNDVLVGDVWLAAGQSNMQMQVRAMAKHMPAARDWVQSADQPKIRFRRVNDKVLGDKEKEATDLFSREPWVVMRPDTVVNFSAVGAVFAREIAENIGCPVGVIDVSWGGKPIEPFIPREEFSTPLLAKIRDLADRDQLEELKALHGGVIIRNPEGYPGAIFNARMAPWTGFSLKGFLWYQAESNAGRGEDPREYRHKMVALAKGVRSRWNEASLPFYYVQLPSFPPATGWIRMREEQRLAGALIPHSDMAVTIDIRGEGIHPPDKLEVGKRLAACALRGIYRKDNAGTPGPEILGFEMNHDKAVVRFDSDLMTGNRPVFSNVVETPGGPLKWFELTGQDGKWHPATATIDKRNVIVTSEKVPSPVAVRYACDTSPQGGNLYSKSGRPVSPFCSNLEMLGWVDQK